MSKKRKGSQFWQSAWMNEQTFLMYRMWILTLAINRFKWVGLPETCDPRFLEETLALQGVATISTPPGAALWTSTEAVTNGAPNIYNTPKSWRSYAVGGFGYDVTPKNGVLVYNSQLRSPFPMGWIDMYARRLADCDRVSDINLQQQKRPWVITAPYERVNDLVQIYKQASGGEPAILGLKGLTSDVDVQALGTPVEFIADKIDDYQRRIWNNIYTFLGIENLTQKAERRVENEIRHEDMPTSIMALDALNARRTAVDFLNSRHGFDCDCVWDYDNITRTFQAIQLATARMLEGDNDEYER